MNIQEFFFGLNQVPETTQFINEIADACCVKRLTAWRWAKGLSSVPKYLQPVIAQIVSKRLEKEITIEELFNKNELNTKVQNRTL